MFAHFEKLHPVTQRIMKYHYKQKPASQNEIQIQPGQHIEIEQGAQWMLDRHPELRRNQMKILY